MSPPLKRKRTVAEPSDKSKIEDTSNTTRPTRSETIYLDDGNLVLVAEDVAFCVHRSQLARHSNLFHDMLAVVDQPPDAESFDGLPVVRLSDKYMDVSALLRALYDRTQFDLNDMDQLIGVLRLSTKYLIDHVRVAALETLAEAYPDTLLKYDNYKGSRHGCGDVIKLAYEIHADILLPAAYYTLCSYNAAKIVKAGLSQQVVEVCLVGKERLSSQLSEFVHEFITGRDTSLGCTRHHNCLTAFETLDTDAHRAVCAFTSQPPDPLMAIKALRDMDCAADVCLYCLSDFKGDVSRARRKLWSSLPDMFSLGSWEELENRN